jgi:hypothetical protein
MGGDNREGHAAAEGGAAEEESHGRRREGHGFAEGAAAGDGGVTMEGAVAVEESHGCRRREERVAWEGGVVGMGSLEQEAGGGAAEGKETNHFLRNQ